MRILHCVESYYPAVGGMQEVVKQLSERLVKLGHEVVVATKPHPERKNALHNGVKIEEFNISGNYASGMTGAIEQYQTFLIQSKFDIIVFFAAQQWATDAALDILSKIKSIKISVPTGYSGLYAPTYVDYFNKMKQWIHNYDMNVYLSNDYRDINFAKEQGISQLTLIPNGAGADEFLTPSAIDIRKKLNIPAHHFLLLHVGSYTGHKGHKEAVQIFLRSKLKNATLLMIGNKYEYFKRQFIKDPLFGLLQLKKFITSKKVLFTFLSREDTVAAFKKADLFFFPSNIECSPIVLFEAMAAHLPFLTTDVGNSREIIEWSKGGKLLPTFKNSNGFSFAVINDSINILNSLYDNKNELQKLADQGHHAWETKFSWEIITKKYEELYSTLLNERNSK